MNTQIEESTIGEMTKVLVPSFKQSMFYDPDFALLLGGGNSNDPCSPQDLMWTWICLGFLLGVIVLCVLIALVEWRVSFVRRLMRGEEGYETDKYRREIAQNKKESKSQDTSKPNQ